MSESNSLIAVNMILQAVRKIYDELPEDSPLKNHIALYHNKIVYDDELEELTFFLPLNKNIS